MKKPAVYRAPYRRAQAKDMGCRGDRHQASFRTGDRDCEEESIHNRSLDCIKVWLKIVRRGAGMMAPLVKWLPCKHEN